jgi:hypothetical protein
LLYWLTTEKAFPCIEKRPLTSFTLKLFVSSQC